MPQEGENTDTLLRGDSMVVAVPNILPPEL